MRRGYLYVTTALVALGGPAAADDAPTEQFDLGTVEVRSAQRDTRSILDTPVAASVLEGERLERRQASDLQELIGDIPGVSIGGGPRSIAQEPNIRGFVDEQIVLRFDGARFNFNQAHRGRFFIDPDIIQRVEVIRGGGSTLYGSGALGGVISFETKDAADLLDPGQTVGARLRLGYGTNGRENSVSGTAFGDWGQTDALVFLGTRMLGTDLESGNGFAIPFSQLDQYNGLVKFGFEPNDDLRFEFSYNAYRDDGLAPANSEDNPDATNPVIDREANVQAVQFGVDYAPTGSDFWDLSALFYYNTLEIDESRQPPNTPRFDETTYDTIGLEIVNRSRFGEAMPVDIVYGFEIFEDSQSGSRDGAPRLSFPDAEARTIGIFAEATVGITSQLDLIAGLRYDDYDRDPNDPTLPSANEDFWSPRIGVSYRTNQNWQIFGNIARAFRAPSLSELYNSGLHFAGNPFGPFPPDNFFVPNPNLEPEESTQYEIGTRYENTNVFMPGDRMTFSANAYYADFDNFIEQTVILFNPITFQGETTANNVPSATLYGFESEIDYDAGSWFLGAGLSIARGENNTAGGDLGSIPQDRITFDGGIRPTEDWTFGARVIVADNQSRVPATGTRSPGFEVVDLYGAYIPQSGPLEGGEVRFGIDNIFDEQYTIYPNALAQPGRSFEMSAVFRF